MNAITNPKNHEGTQMDNYEKSSRADRLAYLAKLGTEIDAERKRLASELRELLNERRLARYALAINENSNLQYSI